MRVWYLWMWWPNAEGSSDWSRVSIQCSSRAIRWPSQRVWSWEIYKKYVSWEIYKCRYISYHSFLMRANIPSQNNRKKSICWQIIYLKRDKILNYGGIGGARDSPSSPDSPHSRSAIRSTSRTLISWAIIRFLAPSQFCIQKSHPFGRDFLICNGGIGGARTRDLGLKRALLYQLSYNPISSA